MGEEVENETETRRASGALRHLEPIVLVAVPVCMIVCIVNGIEATAGLTLLVALLALALMFLSFEAARPALRQLMPTAVLGAIAAAGRVIFAPIPDVKPVSAITIIAGATLGRQSGFMVGALAALLSNFFFGQGSWTPWQMYAWGLVGYVAGVLADHKLLEKRVVLYGWAVVSGLVYGAILNGYYVLGFVRPLTWQAVGVAVAAALPLDIIQGVSTAVFLAIIWEPWGRSIRRTMAKYDMRGGAGRRS